jgi:hypothetical protein
MTRAVAGRMGAASYYTARIPGIQPDATKPPGAREASSTKATVPPWGGLGGYPITPRVLNVPWA